MADLNKSNNEKKVTEKFIYLTGCDGTGKTTQTTLLIEKLTLMGLKPKHLWLRFPFFLSLPFLFYARITGASWYEKTDSYNHGYWDFQNSWVLRNIFPWALLIDVLGASIIKIKIPLMIGRKIVCERFAIDTLVDISVAINDLEFFDKVPGKYFFSALPTKNTKIIGIDLDKTEIIQRRPSMAFDKKLDSRLYAFRKIYQSMNIQYFWSSVEKLDLNKKILNYIMEK